MTLMILVVTIANYLVEFFWLCLIVRIVVEMVKSFSPAWRPAGWKAALFEIVFTVTDPPIKLLRRTIPPVSLGAVRLDLSVLVVFFAIIIVQTVLMSLGAQSVSLATLGVG